jgi:type I restriction enzyme S subunit
VKSKNSFKETEIGMIPEDWEVKKLDGIKSSAPKAIAMGPFGSNIRKENYKETGVPVIRGFNLKVERFLDDNFVFLSEEKAGELAGSSAFPEDIIFVAQGGVGQVGIIPRDAKYERYILSQNLMKISCDKEKADPFFVFYFFRSKRGQDEILSYINPTGVPCISQPLSSLKLFRVPSPNLGEQKIIGGVLSSLDEKIELNQKMSLTMEKIGQALFKHWFVDFEFHDDNGKPYKSSGGKMVDSEIGEIPKGWQVKKVGDVIDIFGGTTPSTKEPKYWEGGTIHWATPKDLSELDSPVLIDTERKITPQGLATISSGLLPAGTVLLSSRAPIGYTAISQIPVSINQGFIAMVCKRELTNYYVFSWVQFNLDIIKSVASGTTFEEVNKSNFRRLDILVPPSGLLSKFSTIFGSLYERILNNSFKARTLASVRDSLLPRLMSGRIRVRMQ